MIEQFVAQSIGEWRSMRSSHSLAFQHFEEIVSKISIKSINPNEAIIKDSIQKSPFPNSQPMTPFSIEWCSESDWEINNQKEELSGKTILIPLNIPNKKGLILRSQGYAEKVSAVSKFSFMPDGTFVLNTEYNETIAEEKIWFISESVRCRASILRTISSQAILQTSFASEVKILKA